MAPIIPKRSSRSRARRCPSTFPLDLGTQLQVQTPDGRAMPVVVTEVTEEQVTLDANHPLAGKDLTFAVEVVGVE